MKLKDTNLEAIVLRVTKYKLPTRVVASQFKISQRRVQQIVRLSNITGELPKHKQPGRRPYAVYPVELRAEIIQAKSTLDLSASGIAKHLRKKRGIRADVNLVQKILLDEGSLTRTKATLFRLDYPGNLFVVELCHTPITFPHGK